MERDDGKDPAVPLSERKQFAVLGSLAAVATAHPDLQWSAWCTGTSLFASVSLVSRHTHRRYSRNIEWHLLLLEQSEYVPVFDRLRGIARELWETELADCRGDEKG